ncbi:TlpA disulfide reductase family protein [uncultured Chryseobacterium sp.]|uniref:TlpA disulfide reductase family protein n=1 Tax=uncultured Chryseobacterium sp. TaxID=259322 RepID=UPI0025E5D6DF|nr:TlpA disulfide reductase family protein [uncultured Chryseobacterium sp.]
MKSIFLHLFAIFLFTSCSKTENETIIKGDIPNLPDGTLYIFKESMLNKLDSVFTINGKFKLKYKNQSSTPIYIGLFHIDKKNIKRIFGFPTNVPHWGSSVFMSDPLIEINGNIKEYKPVNILPPKDIIFINSPRIKSGKQTIALLNSGDPIFNFNIVNATVINTIKEKIIQYPFSYFLLEKIDDNKNSFSPKQVDEFLKLFKGEITESESFKKLSVYNKKRFNEKNIAMPLLENASGEKSEILDPRYKKHLVVFWASWCGPCRQEIPLLKTIYNRKDSNLEFISVSIDADKNEWEKALKEEKMNWKQFIINEKDPDYEKVQMRFRLNGAIPYTVLIDNRFKIIKSTVGLSSDKELEKFIDIK